MGGEDLQDFCVYLVSYCVVQVLPGTELTKNKQCRVEIKYDEVVKIMKLHS